MKRLFLFLKEKLVISVLVILFIYVIGWYGYTCIIEKVCKIESLEKYVRHSVSIVMPNGTLMAEVVDTDRSRSLGLSGRKLMNSNEGMLFVFGAPGRYGFWMKDMLFPIDVVWINQDGVVVYVEPNLTPEFYPKTFMNKPEASYVLEMNVGKAEQYGLFLGSKIKIENN